MLVIIREQAFSAIDSDCVPTAAVFIGLVIYHRIHICTMDFGAGSIIFLVRLPAVLKEICIMNETQASGSF